MSNVHAEMQSGGRYLLKTTNENLKVPMVTQNVSTWNIWSNSREEFV
jgi:hypothetical protein